MESHQSYILVGDLGGTQVRLRVYTESDTEPTFSEDSLTKDSLSLLSTLRSFLAKFQASIKSQHHHIEKAVLAIAGPVVGDTVPILVDIPQWGSPKEYEYESELGIKRVKFINDFVANGYGIITAYDYINVYDPEESQNDNVRLVYGIGTGLGVCLMARPDEDSQYNAFPSEAGMIKMQYYNKVDKEFHKFLIEKGHNQGREDVSLVLGGCSLPHLAEFYAAYEETKPLFMEKSPLYSVLPTLKLTPEILTHNARDLNDILATTVVDHFLDYAAKYLTDLALMTLPFGGIYLTGSVLNVGLRYIFEDPVKSARFIEKFQNRGSQAELLKRIPIRLVVKKDLAMDGCLDYARYYLKC